MSGFRKKKCEQAFLRIGVYGPTGSGKTFSTLLFAEGLAKLEKKRVAYIDTEHGTDFYVERVPQRKVHPEPFDIDCLDTRSLTEALREVKKLDFNVYGVTVIDSVTQMWEGAIGAYEGKKTSIGSIPMHAWGPIKKPYKELINFLLNARCHVFILGREGNEFARDEETDELQVIGKKMKSEGETPYEPQILLRMEPLKKQNATTTYRAYAEKDRTGILAGRLIVNPSFESVIAPLLPLLGKTQAVIPSAEETATEDAVALAEADAIKQSSSTEKREEFEALFKLARSVAALDAVADKLTPEIKKQMLPADVTTLREYYRQRQQQLSGERRLEPA